MKKILNSKYFELTALFLGSFFNFLFTIILYSCGVTKKYGGQTIWETAFTSSSSLKYVCIALIALFVVGLFFFIISSVFLLAFKKKNCFLFYIIYQLVVILVIFFLHIIYQMLGVGGLVLIGLNGLLLTVLLMFFMYKNIDSKEIKESQIPEATPKQIIFYKRLVLLIETTMLVLVFSIFFIPLFSVKTETGTVSYILINALKMTKLPIYISIIFIVLFLAFFLCLFYYTATISYFVKINDGYVKRAKRSIYANVAILLVYFIVGFFLSFYNNIKEAKAYTISYIPFLIGVVVLIVFSIFQGRIGLGFEDQEKIETNKKFKLEPLFYVIALTGVTFLTLCFNVIEIKVKVASKVLNTISMSGYQLLTDYGKLGGGYQGLAFVIFAMLVISGLLLVVSIVSYFAKYKDYYKVIKFSSYCNVIFMLLLGLFGIYFQIAQKINEDNIKSVLQDYNITLPVNYTLTASSQAFYIFIISFVIYLVMMCRGVLNLKLEAPFLEVKSTGESNVAPNSITGSRVIDACPAFRELDSKQIEFNQELEKRLSTPFQNLSLPDLVQFIVDYARESRLHLSYTREDIATFIGGLGASRLTILQGMSGTGKTSLPKIVAEAILGNCEIIEVESSWRDKNELLGYYNEFSKCYTPKKFTQALYKAKLNEDIPTFIVLDEMNLSRIEYYFSDFLSLMENEEDKRAIKLLNIKLAYIEEGVEHTYKGLKEGHTLQIPKNVWFIGTANRDESTFEISDKVYDRAQTMNFTKRAPKAIPSGVTFNPRFVSYERLTELFQSAKTNLKFDAEKNKIIQKVESLLIPYNISFGNRILNQMEDFVKLYCACFEDPKQVFKDAIEKIVLSKVVSKFEFKIVENKEMLATEFDKIGLKRCSEFIRKLNED